MTVIPLDGIFLAWYACIGAAIGSFLNVVIYRIPRGYLLTLPARSICTSCKRRLSGLDNIPILSYIFLRGKCGGCRKKIALRYPLVELLTMILFVALFRFWGGLGYETLFYSIFSAALVAITFIDLDFQIIPDVISIPIMITGVAFSPFISKLGFIQSVGGAAAGGLSFWFLAWIYEKITKREGLGFGDVKLLAMIGAFLGVKNVFVTVVLSSFYGSIVGLSMMVIQKKNLKHAIPFGPFLALGALTTLFWGEYITLRFFSFYAN